MLRGRFTPCIPSRASHRRHTPPTSLRMNASSPKIAKRVACLKPALTLALSAKAKTMQAQGIDVANFGAGEPDFDTPEFIKDVAIEDLRKGFTKYTAERGGAPVLEAITQTLKRDYGLDYKASQVILSNGGKHSLYNIFLTLVDDGDEVIIPAPYWLSYPEQIRSAGGVPVCVPCAQTAGFRITPEQLEAAITPRTVAFVLNSPGNPTGAVYSRDHLLALGDVLRRHPHVWLISDDLYQHLVFEGAEFHSLPAMMPELLSRTIIVNGLSKAYAMTGWRLGWCAAPEPVSAAMANLQGHATSNVASFLQRAAATALLSDHAWLVEWRAAFARRRALILEGLRAIPGVKVDPAPQGAFYVFPDVSAHYGRTLGGRRVDNSLEFAQALLEVGRVALVPGVVFGDDKCVRFSYATSEETIRKGVERLAAFLG